MQVTPLPLTGTFFVPTLTPAVSRLVVSAMRSLGLLDSQSYLTFSPRYSSQVRWRPLPPLVSPTSHMLSALPAGARLYGVPRRQEPRRRSVSTSTPLPLCPPPVQPWLEEVAALVPELSLRGTVAGVCVRVCI